MVLWLGLDQTRQHLFTEVRIPGSQSGLWGKEGAKEGRQGKLVDFVTDL
jgi:hypothetical protein